MGEWVTDEVWLLEQEVLAARLAAAVRPLAERWADIVAEVNATIRDAAPVVAGMVAAAGFERFELDEWQVGVLEAALAPVSPLSRLRLLVPRSTGPTALCIDGREYRRRSRRRRR